MDSIMKKVKSSNIEAIGYDDDRNVLYVQFHGGGLYSYAPFDSKRLAKFMQAESKGKWFQEHIRFSKEYEVKRIQ